MFFFSKNLHNSLIFSNFTYKITCKTTEVMDDKARIAKLEKELKKAQEKVSMLERKNAELKQAKKELKKKESRPLSQKEKEVISVMFPGIDLSKLP